MRFISLHHALIILPLAGLLLTACDNQPAPVTREDTKILTVQVSSSIQSFKTTDPSLDRFFRDAYGYAVFPAVRAAAIGVGGAYGQAEVY